jgi:hypothetical protein
MNIQTEQALPHNLSPLYSTANVNSSFIKAKIQVKVLSLLQPWATFVVIAVKKIETRSWITNHRGTLLIHASKGKAGSMFAHKSPFKKYIPDFNRLPFGAIIGQVELVDVMKTEALGMSDEHINKLTLEEKAFGDYESGRYAWMLEDAVMFKEVFYCRGSMSLWNCPSMIEKEILKVQSS